MGGEGGGNATRYGQVTASHKAANQNVTGSEGEARIDYL
jgi:hypothetical protein